MRDEDVEHGVCPPEASKTVERWEQRVVNCAKLVKKKKKKKQGSLPKHPFKVLWSETVERRYPNLPPPPLSQRHTRRGVIEKGHNRDILTLSVSKLELFEIRVVDERVERRGGLPY